SIQNSSMPRVQAKAPGILPSRSISRGSRISTITTSASFAALMASAALIVSISALASSIMALMPRLMFWDISLNLLALAHQFLHRVLQPLDRDRIHALGENLADNGGRFLIVPMSLRQWVEPHGMRIGADDAIEPDRPGLLVDMLDRATGHHNLVRRHRGVADKHDLVVVGIFVEDVPGGRAVGETPLVLLPYAFIKAVVEVEIFHVLEFAFCGRKQFFHLLDMRIHRAADVEEHQNLHRVAPFGAHHHVEITVIGGLPDRGVEIEFLGRASAGELAQPAQRDLDVADAEFDVAVEIPELAAVPDLDRTEIPVLLLADPHAFRIVAVRTERRGTGGADPLVAALVAALLFLEALAKGLHELVPAHRLDLLLLFLGQVLFRELLQPFGGDLRLLHGIEQALQSLEHGAKHPIELVEVALVLHQR